MVKIMFNKLSRREVIFAVLLLAALFVHSAAPTPVNADPTPKWCSGVNIVMFPGGTPGGAFESVVYNGALQATADLGPTTQYIWSDWAVDKMITQFKQAVATKPDGIAIMGHPGDDAYKLL